MTTRANTINNTHSHFATRVEMDREFDRKRREQRRRRENRIKRAKFDATVKCIEVIVVISMILGVFGYFTKNFEVHSSTARYDLMLQLEDGNKEAINFYRDRYINRDIYLFDGNMTIELMANRHNLDAETLIEAYKTSGYDSVQEWFDNDIKPLV